MKVVIAIDSFKGSLTSMEAGLAIKEGIDKVMEAEVVIKPLADGGEGLLDVLLEAMGGIKKHLEVTGPLGQKVNASYGIIPDLKTAVIEMAEAAGITLVEEKNPLEATTYGVGELITAAVREGCKDIVIGIGGSATNDGGIGMLQALGYSFFDKSGNETGQGGACLGEVSVISDEKRIEGLDKCRFMVASDVDNPLYGPQGATYIYGPQKGVTKDNIDILEEGMKNWGEVTKTFTKKDNVGATGAGAAGGLGFALKSYLGAELRSGAQLVFEITKMEEEIIDADIVITGEGRLDEQTAMGKGPVGVAELAKKYGAKVIALSGCLGDGAEQCNKKGIDAYFTILNRVETLEMAMDKENAKKNMKTVTEQIFNLVKLFC